MKPEPPSREPPAGEAGSAEEALARAESLLQRLERSRERLESTDDADTAIDVLTELSEIAKQIEREIAEAKRRAEAGEEPRASA